MSTDHNAQKIPTKLRKDSFFNDWCLEHWISIWEKKVSHITHIYQLKMEQSLQCKMLYLEMPRRKHSGNLDIGLSNIFIYQDQKDRCKNKQMGLYQIRKLPYIKESWTN
jgi:hypothetical protein